MSQISLLETSAYDPLLLRASVESHFDNLGVCIPADAHVVIKPNLIMRCTPERAATPHPLLLEALLACLRDRGVRRITIADSPGGLYTPGILRGVYMQTGFWDAAEKYGAVCNTQAGSRERSRKENKLCHTFDIIDPVLEADCLISLCKLKTHCMMTFTCGVKNLFGCIPGLLKPQMHYRFPEEDRFAQMLVDLAETVRPDLTLVDGVVGMEGDGPTGGKPHPLGVTAAARYDGLYDLDLVLAHMIGISPAQAPTIREAMERGLCAGLPGQAAILGDTALAGRTEPFRLPKGKELDFSANLPAPLGGLVRRMKPRLAPRPVVRRPDCIGCGKCAETCPAHVITMEGHKAEIHAEHCIRCFCCHELCPEKAIGIKAPSFFRMFSR